MILGHGNLQIDFDQKRVFLVKRRQNRIYYYSKRENLTFAKVLT